MHRYIIIILLLAVSCHRQIDRAYDHNVGGVTVSANPMPMPEGKQFKVPIRITTNIKIDEGLLDACLMSIVNANELFTFIQFELVELTYFLEEYQDTRFHHLYETDITLSIQDNNIDEVVNIYLILKDPNHLDGRIAFVERFNEFTIKHGGGLCDSEMEHDPNTIYMSDEAMYNTHTLTHELGHYFNLKHCLCCTGPSPDPSCYLNRMNEVYTYCDATLTENQLLQVWDFLPYRECVVYSIDYDLRKIALD